MFRRDTETQRKLSKEKSLSPQRNGCAENAEGSAAFFWLVLAEALASACVAILAITPGRVYFFAAQLGTVKLAMRVCQLMVLIWGVWKYSLTYQKVQPLTGSTVMLE